MAEQISVLQPCDAAHFDEDTLNGLSRDLGVEVAENILCRALEDMGARFSHIRATYADGDMRGLHKSVRGMIPIADQIGLPGVAGIGKDVLVCIDRADPVALAATLCRLLRCGEMALSCAEMGLDLTL